MAALPEKSTGCSLFSLPGAQCDAAPSTSTSADDLREIEEEAKTRFSTYGKLRR